MEAVALTNHELEMEDVEYLRHGDMPYLLRLHKPAGNGPFPLIVQLHGGAWCRGDRMNDSLLNEAPAKSGVVVAALEWRMPPIASYPAALTDINYAIRWCKTQATQWGSRPDLVGALGSSSGAHQAMLASMRPRDPRYAAIPLPAGARAVDASLRCVVLCWPVIDPQLGDVGQNGV
jgi:acetyl esterase/lipase